MPLPLMKFRTISAGLPACLPQFCFLVSRDFVLKSCTTRTINDALLPLLYFLLNSGQCYNCALKILLSPHTFHNQTTNLIPCFAFFPFSFFFQLILNCKVITGVWQLELLLKCPCVILNSWHLFCNLWLFYCISKKIMLSQSNCAIRFFFFYSL